MLPILPPPPDHIRLRFVTDKASPLSGLIRFDTMADVSHVEAVMLDGTVIGAYGDGVKNIAAAEASPDSTMQIMVDIALPPSGILDWTEYLHKKVGAPYDYRAIAGFALHTDLHTPGAIICSALQTMALRHAGFFPTPLSVRAHEISPRDLLLLLSSHRGVTIHAPQFDTAGLADHSKVQLGRIAPRLVSKAPMFASYAANLPPVQPAADWTKGASAWGMMANDRLGDCTACGVAHLEQVWTLATRGEWTANDHDVVDFYSKSTGYDPANPSSDRGGVEDMVLGYWLDYGFCGRRIVGYASINPKTVDHVKQSVALLGGCYTGVALPLAAQTQSVWDVPASGGLVGDAAPGTWGGHCMVMVGYNPTGPVFITWGELKQATWAWWLAYGDEAYAVLGSAFIAQNKSPGGFPVEALQADMKVLAA